MKWQVPAEENFWQNRKIMTEILISSWNFYLNWITEVPLRNYQISYGSEVMTFCLDFIVMFSTYQLYVTSILWNVINIIYDTINITVDFVQDGEQLILHFSNNQKRFLNSWFNQYESYCIKHQAYSTDGMSTSDCMP